MNRKLILPFAFLVIVLHSSCQESSKYNIKKSSLDEFELLNLCHCHEYLMLRHYDYVKWKSEGAKENTIEEEKYLVFGQYTSSRQFSLYFQKKYDSTLFYKHGISIMLENANLNFKRLDSLYYEPLAQYYVQKLMKTNPVPYLGLNYNNFYWDCFHRVKEISLEKELEYFIQANQKKP